MTPPISPVISTREIACFSFVAEDQACGICLGTCSEKHPAIQLRQRKTKTGLLCGHIFHPECLNEWVLRRSECPLCRRSLKSLLSEKRGERRARTLMTVDAPRGRWGLQAQSAKGIAQGLSQVVETIVKVVQRALGRRS